ncbi:MAG TPA: apolipoprotein N-acyltransferase [Candidatus Eisenbacteria bacterium]|nr:apolipoprotein N-acyltransferase [Candidatus Eisenbacteria bacterium]
MRVLGVLLGGLLYALAVPPVDCGAFAWLALVPVLLAVRGQAAVSAFSYGCLFGYAYGWATLWSLADTAVRYFHLVMPLGATAAALWFLVVVGVPFGLFAAAAGAVLNRLGFVVSLVVVPALWVASELLRGRLIGQPWGLLGYTQHRELALAQVAALTGVYGVSFLLALGSTALAETIHRLLVRDSLGRALRVLIAPAAVIGVCWLTGLRALSAAGTPASDSATGRTQQVAIVQTNVTPAARWTPSYTGAQVGAHLRRTDDISPATRPALIVWPENAVPRYLEADPFLASRLAESARRHHADLLLGAPRYEDGRSYNSVRLITASGRNGGHYDKRRLVLFAEEKPFTPRADGDPNRDPDAFASGTGPGVLQSFVRLGVSVCHEILHPDLINDSVRNGAELLVNVANDSWLDGLSEGAGLQHLAMATFRAIETRRYLVRAAITGASAVIDPFGRVVGVLPPGQAGVLTAPVTGLDTLTWYVRVGDLFAFVCVVVALWGLALCVVARHASPAIPARREL